MVCLIKLMYTSVSKTHFESWISFQNTTKDHATDRLRSFSRHSCKGNKVKFTPETHWGGALRDDTKNGW